MKIRSKKLFAFLEAKGVLDGTEEELLKAKKEFRRKYKRDWKRYTRIKRKAINCLFTLHEYSDIKNQAKRIGLRTAQFGREVILSATHNSVLVPNRTELLKALQLVGMTGISLANVELPISPYFLSEKVDYLHQAEQLLMSVLQQHYK